MIATMTETDLQAELPADLRAPATDEGLEAPPRRPRVPGGLAVALAVALQLGALALLPAGKVAAYASPTSVRLTTGQVDPYDLVAGRYVALDYPWASRWGLEQLAGWDEGMVREGAPAWVTLAFDGPTGTHRPVAIATTRPAKGPFIQGRFQGGSLVFGADRYYADADTARAVERAEGLRATEVSLDADGNPAVTAVWVGSARY